MVTAVLNQQSRHSENLIFTRKWISFINKLNLNLPVLVLCAEEKKQKMYFSCSLFEMVLQEQMCYLK